MQFFVGLHLLYRIVLWSAAAFPSNNAKIFLFMFFWLVILGIHSLFQPFENRRHNYLEALLMVNVALAAASYGSYFYNLTSYQDSLWREILFTVPVVFANLPLACVIVYYLWKIFRRFRCCCLCKKQEFLVGKEDSFRGDRWVPPNKGPFAN
jgi:drug/metabolite transporter (DMT)-like permease